MRPPWWCSEPDGADSSTCSITAAAGAVAHPQHLPVHGAVDPAGGVHVHLGPGRVVGVQRHPQQAPLAAGDQVGHGEQEPLGPGGRVEHPAPSPLRRSP